MFLSNMCRNRFILAVVTSAAVHVTTVECAQKLTSWRGPSSYILGTPPSERKCHGLASALEKIFIFGGTASSGGIDTKIFFAVRGHSRASKSHLLKSIIPMLLIFTYVLPTRYPSRTPAAPACSAAPSFATDTHFFFYLSLSPRSHFPFPHPLSLSLLRSRAGRPASI
jgi:hypothetical protein